MRVRVAATVWTRLRGLLLRPKEYLGNDGVLALVPCSSIHTVGMAYPLDVAFVGADGRVLKAEKRLLPGNFLRCRDAAVVLERPASDSKYLSEHTDYVQWFEVGDFVELGCLAGRQTNSKGQSKSM